MAEDARDRLAELEARLGGNGRADSSTSRDLRTATAIEDTERASRTIRAGEKALRAEEAAEVAGRTAKAGREIAEVREGSELALGFSGFDRATRWLGNLLNKTNSTAQKVQSTARQTESALQQAQKLQQNQPLTGGGLKGLLDVNDDGAVNLKDLEAALKGKDATMPAEVAKSEEAPAPLGMPPALANTRNYVASTMPAPLAVTDGVGYWQRYTQNGASGPNAGKGPKK